MPQVDGLVLVDPPDDRAAKRLDGAPWIAPVWDRAPVAVGGPQAPADDAAGAGAVLAAPQGLEAAGSATRMTLQSSLAQWSTYAQKQSMERLQAAQATAPKRIALPQTARPDPALDAWVKMETAQGAIAERVTSTKVGADYRIGRSALVGFSAASQEKDLGAQQAQAVASYFAVKPLPMVTLDGRAGVLEAHAGPLDGMTSAQQRFAMARLKSELPVGAFKLAPTVSISQGSETIRESGKDAGRDAGSAAHESGTLGFAPRLSRPFELKSGAKVEPYVSLDRKLALEQQAPDRPRATTALGAGLSLKKPDAYTLDFSASMEELGRDKLSSTGPGETKGRLELKMPLR